MTESNHKNSHRRNIIEGVLVLVTRLRLSGSDGGRRYRELEPPHATSHRENAHPADFVTPPCEKLAHNNTRKRVSVLLWYSASDRSAVDFHCHHLYGILGPSHSHYTSQNMVQYARSLKQLLIHARFRCAYPDKPRSTGKEDSPSYTTSSCENSGQPSRLVFKPPRVYPRAW
ncbi:uncharacterized protein PV06_10029 [Exophiala oligosperma]|uniref:Uncharacterized protein n=1 Tax=Exophiala oligosperma TaxID=215243 RepID=A0A0D2D4A8_9EURO|nr:uncharacterized protein PV06_10029 [Exophiala oligosperma]KIW38058.1 hypothetical protein PV06_10029 [Exophiala oligosperma]